MRRKIVISAALVVAIATIGGVLALMQMSKGKAPSTAAAPPTVPVVTRSNGYEQQTTQPAAYDPNSAATSRYLQHLFDQEERVRSDAAMEPSVGPTQRMGTERSWARASLLGQSWPVAAIFCVIMRTEAERREETSSSSGA